MEAELLEGEISKQTHKTTTTRGHGERTQEGSEKMFLVILVNKPCVSIA